MKILLVQVIDPRRSQDAILPAGLGYLAAYLRQELDDLDIRLAQHNLREMVRTYRPDVVGISVVTQNYDRARQFSAWCKAFDPSIVVIVGGHHISALPDTLSPDMDLAVLGEGERTMLQVCQILQSSGLDYAALSRVEGIAYRSEDGELVVTPPRPLIRDLDTLPMPARDLMHIRRGDAIGIISSRGCPYNCVFCASKSFWGAPRFHSAEYVVREVESILTEFQPQHIYLWDDLFVAHRRRFRHIVHLMVERGIPDRVKFSLNCRANLVDQELIALMGEMNVFEVSLGLESFSSKTLSYLKDRVTVQDNWRAIDLLSRAGIRILGFFIIGSPHETRQEILETLSAFEDARLHRAQAYILAPLPGTPVWQYASTRGLVSEDMEWNKLYIDAPEDEQNGIVLSETLEPAEIRELLESFQRVRRRKEARIRFRKVLFYARLAFVDFGTIWSLIKKTWQLRIYKLKHRLRREET